MRYHFHIRDPRGLILDEEGSELPDITAARHEARASACDLITEDLRSQLCVQDRQIEIADAAGRVLETMPVRNVLN